MSIYDKSSLVLIPSGTKSGKVYSQKPVSGDGDFTFTRSSAATRVNADGNIEKETQNLLLQSNTFSNAVWADDAGGCTRTSGQSGYDGTANAWLITQNGTGFENIVQSVSSSGVNTYSVYAKGTSTAFALRIANTGDRVLFNLSTGSVASTFGSNLIDYGMTDVGGGWYRCYLTANATITDLNIYPYFNSTTATSVTIQDAQLEQGLVARDYIETTTTAVEGGITDNVPRLDYTDSSCPALLLEPQRTNKLSNSEYINSGSTWVEENGADCTPNYSTSPEGVDNATRVQLDNSGAFSLTRIWCNFSPDSSSDTASFYAKSNTGSSFDIVIYFRDSGFGSVRGNKTITLTNEWQRFDLTADCSGATGNVMFLIYNTTANENWDFLMYGAQVEAGSYATSYIPTYGSSVTRVADATIKSTISDLIGQTEGTIFIEFDAEEDAPQNMNLINFNNSTQASVLIAKRTSGALRAQVFAGGSAPVDINSAIVSGKTKAAIAYKSGDSILYVNGVGVSDSSTFTFNGTLSEVIFPSHQAYFNYGHKYSVNQALLFKTRLSNEELAALTTI